jgi:hypothetical protein
MEAPRFSVVKEVIEPGLQASLGRNPWVEAPRFSVVKQAS